MANDLTDRLETAAKECDDARSESEAPLGEAELYREAKTKLIALTSALRIRSIAHHYRLTHGGGKVLCGYSCELCKSSWDVRDAAGSKLLVPEIEHHVPTCLLNGTKE